MSFVGDPGPTGASRGLRPPGSPEAFLREQIRRFSGLLGCFGPPAASSLRTGVWIHSRRAGVVDLHDLARQGHGFTISGAP